MKNDVDFERDLELWLEESASPMPDRLAESIATVPERYGQLAGGVRPIWLRRSSIAAALAASALLVAVVGPILVERTQNFFGSVSSPPPTYTWDAFLNFREWPNQLNPSPDAYGNTHVWSYLRSRDSGHDPDGYVPLADFEPDGARNWYDADYENLFVGYAQGADRLTLHPWGGGPGDVRAAIVAWRSPVDGVVTAQGDVEVDASCGDGTILSVDHGSTTLETVDVQRGLTAFEVTANVRVGDSLYFRVDPGADSNCDTTWLRLRIER